MTDISVNNSAASLRRPLEFVRNGKTDIVHVVAEPETPFPTSLVTEFASMGPAWEMAVMPSLARCGWVGRTAPGFDAYYVASFADDDLCRSCHRSLGDQSSSAFEHQQPEPSGSEPT